MADHHALDPHERPPDDIRAVYKKYQKMKEPRQLDADAELIDFARGLSDAQQAKIRIIDHVRPEQIRSAFAAFEEATAPEVKGIFENEEGITDPVPIYEHEDLPGLHILPNLLPPTTQWALLTRLLHTDLSNPAHLTNIHTHYSITYPPPSSSTSPTPSSFFTNPPTQTTPIAHPHTPTIHRALAPHPFLTKKLRWTTLGGQYNWTTKQYPSTTAPAFPAPLAALCRAVWPRLTAQAAIANLYSPGDTLALHRDVAERVDRGLASLSLGCDALFVCGVGGGGAGGAGTKTVVLRLRSGDAVYMDGPARWAWHGVPVVVRDTCPAGLREWPARPRLRKAGGGGGGGGEGEGEDGEDGEEERTEEEEKKKEEKEDPYEAWRGWMAGKRVNLNVRQIWD